MSSGIGNVTLRSQNNIIFFDLIRFCFLIKNVLQFPLISRLISAHNQIQSIRVSRSNQFQHMKLLQYFLYSPIKTATHSLQKKVCWNLFGHCQLKWQFQFMSESYKGYEPVQGSILIMLMLYWHIFGFSFGVTYGTCVTTCCAVYLSTQYYSSASTDISLSNTH